MFVAYFRAKDYYTLHFHIQTMPKLRCSDYGFECDFVAESPEVSQVIDDYGKHSEEVHGIEYSKESLMQFILRQG